MIKKTALRMLHLPKILDHVQFTVNKGDNGEMVFHIDMAKSHYRHERLSNMDYRHRRKIENLFILAYPRERVRVAFE